MVMWTMSDRAIPRSFRFMEGFGVHTFRLVERRRHVDVRQVPLEAEARHAVGGLERGGEDQRRRSRLPPPRPVGRDQQRRLPRVGARRPAVRRRVRRLSSTSTCSTPPRSSPRSSCRSVGSAAWCSTAPSTTSSPRPSRSRSAPRTSSPGIDFTNDPLLQGRNFSYLDTQLKRLGGPNFTHLPVNAPKCPVAHFQQDGHMAMTNPVGRVNYEPNSWSRRRGPREDPSGGFTLVRRAASRAPSSGCARSASPTTTARRGSSSISQTPVEQAHIVDAVRVRAVQVRAARDPRPHGGQPAQRRRGARRRDRRRPAASTRSRRPRLPARAPITDLPPSPALSIVENGPASFAGRKFGVLITDGTDAGAARRAAQGGRRPRVRWSS